MTAAKQKAFAADGWTEHVRWWLFPARRNTPIFIKYSYFYKRELSRSRTIASASIQSD